MSTKIKSKLKSFILVTVSGCTAFSGICIYKGNEKFYKNYVMPLVHMLDPETAHNFAVWASRYRILPKSQFKDPDLLNVKIFGKNLSNPIGIAAGFDKDGKAILGLDDIGFGFIEIGSVTPHPQPGNEKPRVFRLTNDNAVINRYGFNSEGHNEVLNRLNQIRASGNFHGIIGVNLGKNKTSVNPVNDYVEGIRKFSPVADYLVINISSPNTPGLRSMQNKEVLSQLLQVLLEERKNLNQDQKPPLLLKLAPDLSYEEIEDIAKVIQRKECKIDGLIISNTTTDRPENLQSIGLKNEVGGLSGKPLKDISTKMISDMRKLVKDVPIIGVGGISSGQDAYEKIKAGANLVQLYTALVYEGPPVVTKVKRQLAELVTQDGYANVSDAVGQNNK